MSHGIYKTALFDHQACITHLKCAEAMRNHHRCPASHHTLHRLHDHRLGGYINRACWLVKDQNRRILQESASQRNTLAFTTDSSIPPSHSRI